MWVQKIPEFHSGHILKQEMMVELSAYLYHLGPLLYQNCTDGIVSGCTLTTTEDSIVVNPGVIRYEGELYLIREPQLIHYKMCIRDSRGMIPLWNLERVEVSTSMYPSPCADHVHYEHRIFAHRLSPGCSYLEMCIRDRHSSLRPRKILCGCGLKVSTSMRPISPPVSAGPASARST